MLQLDVANLVGLIMQSFFYGVFQVLFIACIYVLIYGRTSDKINWHFLITAILMWILIGVNFGLSFSRVIEAFVDLQPALRENPNALIEYFSALNKWKEVTRTAMYIALTAVADTLFIYRLYIVWARNIYVVILPVLLLCGSLTSGMGIEIVLGTTTSSLFSPDLAVWATSFFSISLVQNIITTLLIVYRIWRVNTHAPRGLGSQSLWPVMSIILESGAIYSSTLLVLLGAYAANSYAQYIAIDMLVPIIGITFNMIIVRVGLGLSQSPSGPTGRSTHNTGGLALRKLNINVSRHVTVDRDGDIEQGLGTNETKNQDYAASDIDEPAAWKQTPVAM